MAKYVYKPVEVEGYKIVEVTTMTVGGRINKAHIVLDNGMELTCDEGMVARYSPVVGDYLVTQPDGYQYLNPKAVFEGKFQEVKDEQCDNENDIRRTGLDFGLALNALKSGKKVCRAGWNGKGMFIYLINGTDLQYKMKYGYGECQNELVFVDTICMKSAQNTLVVGWLASQTDMLAHDWEIVE
jgi:hypothetical protein